MSWRFSALTKTSLLLKMAASFVASEQWFLPNFRLLFYRNYIILNHPGMVRMKSLVRLYVWWPSLDYNVEQTVRDCHVCQANHCTSPEKVNIPCIWPTRPWQRIHVDFAGPFNGQMFLLVVDVKSSISNVLNHCFNDHSSPMFPALPLMVYHRSLSQITVRSSLLRKWRTSWSQMEFVIAYPCLTIQLPMVIMKSSEP